MRSRNALGMGVIVALAVAVWAAVTAGGDDPTPTSTSTTGISSTTSTEASTTTTRLTTTTSPATTTTAPTTSTADPEARVEEVRLILEDLYFRWFDAIYRNDEEAVREVIATERYLQDFRRAVETLELPRAPMRDDIRVEEVEILRQDTRCLVTYSTLDVSDWRGDQAVVTGVNVLLRVDDTWRLGTAWTHKGDLWEQDCEIEPEL